ncbi:MAG: RNA polymerase sigma factor [Armatimonadota bacterium]
MESDSVQVRHIRQRTVLVKDSALVQTVEAAQAGDRDAFEALFRAYRDSIFSMAMHYLGDRDVAEDVTQDAFVRAWDQLPKLREAVAFGGWMRALTINMVRDHFRSRREEHPLDESNPLPSGDAGPDSSIERDEQQQAVRDAILGLPDHQRVIVSMHYLEGRPVQEIMDEMGLPKGTVVSRLSRGRENLRRRLAPYIDA